MASNNDFLCIQKSRFPPIFGEASGDEAQILFQEWKKTMYEVNKVGTSLNITIKSLADKMNSMGFIRVIAWQEPSLYKIRHPLIYFDAPLWVAQLMEQALMEAFRRGTDGLKHVWRLRVSFEENAQLKFMLYSPYYGWYSHSTVLSILKLSVLQKYIKAEISAISEILEKTVFLKLGEFKPKQDGCSGNKNEAE